MSPNASTARLPAGVLLAVLVATLIASPAQASPDGAGSRWVGSQPGPYAVGFEQRAGIDHERIINATDGGTRIGLALWYPAERIPSTSRPLTSMDYRLLIFSTPPTEAERRAFEENELDAIVGWPHVGLVDLTREQACQSVAASGIARRGLPAAEGRFPIVMILGGPYYLSTTAEILASHGFLVAAPFRFVDQSNAIGAEQFTWSIENSVRDAEWAAAELRSDPHANMQFLGAVGHGGGGMQAMLFAMRNRLVSAVATIDAANFSRRSRASEVPFYSPRLMRAPYLYIARADTKKSQDLFADFESMKFSDRFELILETRDLRHHDLSDLGRGVTAIGMRGEQQTEIRRAYADVQEALVRFLADRSGRRAAGDDRGFSQWLATLDRPTRSWVSIRPATVPPPTPVDAIDTLSERTASELRQARTRDPEAPVFQPDSLAQLIHRAMSSAQLRAADALSDLAVDIHPADPALLDLRSAILEQLGDVQKARAVAAACAAIDAGNDWRARAAVNRCKERTAAK